MKARFVNFLFWICSVFFLVSLDQYTKLMAVRQLKGNSPFVIFEDVFELFYSENRGAAFGMLQGKQFFFFIIGAVVLFAAAYMMLKMPSFAQKRYLWLKICVSLITAGALGNMIDRCVQGYVVDFLYFKLINFPIFNVADIYVTTATAALVVLICFYYREEELDVFWGHKKSKEKGDSL